MAEVTRTIYPKRIRNREIEESIKLAMAQFKEEQPKILAARAARLTAFPVLNPVKTAA
jgi:hypothetical protein